ncbi:immunity 49 family protein [Streptomyces sp. HU2014]|uniref:immunity 49 family protein n=1 Tax=Streptomyces sp. HU2014 TaxID=2939414 RepID=UPI00200F37D1|nr:immunity 49 family protein [Streptomyces sp. HU2014]UQI49082.1 immunity 49 family protein [Streptomyces sp. HU2014]
MNPKSPAHIARHSVGESRAAEAVEDFASRIGRQVDLMQHSPGRDTFGWEMIAEEFLDYVGALSLTDPELRGKDAEAALRSAGAAALGVVTVGVYQWESVNVFVDYVNFGLTYGPAGDPEVSLDETDWLRALDLAVICDRYTAEAVTFGETARYLPSGPGHPLWERAATGQAHGMLTYLRGYDLDEDWDGAEPRTRAEAAGRIDALLSELAADGNRNRARVAGLTAVRALLTGDENAFGAALARLLTAHRDVAGGSASPRGLLPLDAIALAALAHRREGWPPAVASGYLPAALVTGVRTEGPRVGPYGRDKREAALAELAAGPVTVARPAFAWTDERDDGVYDRLTDRKLAEYADPDADPRLIARMLPSGVRQQVLRFQCRAAHDPEGTDPRQREALTLAAELGVAACATGVAEDGGGVEVTIGGRTLTLPRVGPQPDRMTGGWTSAVGAALVAGARGPLDRLLAVDPGAFGAADASSVTAAYRAALHDHLRGADARPAVDRALAARERALGRDSDDLCPPVVLLSQLVAGDAEGFALALVDALEEHRDHYGVGSRAEGVDAAASLDVLALACRARAVGMPVPVRSPYLPEALLALH